MPAIQFEGELEKSEDAFVLAYAELVFCEADEMVTIKRIPEENVTRPDYFIVDGGELLEVKEVHDRSQNEQWARWGRNISDIRKILESLGDGADVPGTFIVGTPEVFDLTHKPKKQIAGAECLVEAILAGQSLVDVFDAQFTINKVSDQENIISFSNISEARFLNPPVTVAASMKTGINKANQQLGGPPPDLEVKSRKLLFVNKYTFSLHDWELFKATAQVLSDLRAASNIEEVWYQFRDDNNNFIHKRIYNKQFFEQFESGEVGGWTLQDYELFSNWFAPISEWGDDYKEKLLSALKILLEENRPHEIFSSPNNRIEVLRIGLWLASQQRYDEVCWLIEQFIDDPNVSTNADDVDVASELEQQILKGDEVVQIATVLGHLGWLVNQLNVSKTHISRAADYTIKLIGNANLYTKSQAMLSLKELIRRQEWLKEYDAQHETHYFADVRNLAFNLMREYGGYPTIANLLSNAFYYLLDISEEESVEVLQSLKNGKSIGWLYVFYALFRAEQVEEFGEYDDHLANEQLEAVIHSNDDTDEKLVADISWRFWKYLKEHPEDFEKLEPLISEIASRPYQKANYSLEHIIQEWVERKPERCIEWFTKLVDNMTVAADNDEQIGGRLWLSAENTLPVIAEKNPELLANIVSKLVDLWDKGAMVGHPSAVLSTYQLVDNPTLREEIKSAFIGHYEHMRTVQPKLEKVEFT